MNDSQMAGLADDSESCQRIRPVCATDTAPPQVALLSNGRYGVVITAAGSGCSTWRGLDVTRWREDATRDCWGQFCYLRDPAEGTVWSAGYQPLCRAAEEHEVAFHADRPGRLGLGEERRSYPYPRLAAGNRLHPAPLPGLRRGAAPLRARPGLA